MRSRSSPSCTATCAGTFVFVLSDFLGPLPAERVARATAEAGTSCLWSSRIRSGNRAFPHVGSVAVPSRIRDRAQELVRLSRREARELRAETNSGSSALLAELVSLGLDPVLGPSDPSEIDRAFLEWAEPPGG